MWHVQHDIYESLKNLVRHQIVKENTPSDNFNWITKYGNIRREIEDVYIELDYILPYW